MKSALCGMLEGTGTRGRPLVSVFEYPAFCRTTLGSVPYKHLTDNSADNLEKPRRLPALPLCSTTPFVAAVVCIDERLDENSLESARRLENS